MKKTCVHFTGIQNNRCKAGIDYDSFPRGTLPCLGDQIGKAPKSPCSDLRLPTPEETAAEEAAWEAAFARTSKAVEAARNHAKARGLRKGNGGAGNVPCPVCNKRKGLIL